ncbi:MAG: hypothetical protein DMF56_14980 [Acidobacteria bacterium]|nr:MAG: hypothetical protein DMF56_14980 [Acidobacteriota bacterium]
MRRALPLVLAAAAFATLAILWIVTDRRASQRIYDDYSSANTSAKGLSLASGYLAKSHKVAMLTRPLARAHLEPNAIVFRVVDERPLFFDPEDLKEGQFGPPRPKHEPLLNDAEESFVRRGGRLVFAAQRGVLATSDAGEKFARKVFPIWRNLGDLQMNSDWNAFTSLRPRMHTIFASGAHAIVGRERIGAGELFLISAPQLLQNDALARGNHLQFLNALAGTGRPIYFDEVPHGIVSDDGSLALMKDWNLGPFLILITLAAMLYFWRESRRIGPPVDDYRETRSDAVDLVRSLAALYYKVTSYGESLSLYHDALTRTVASQTGLRGDALRKRVDELTGGKRDLTAINDAFAKLQTHRRIGSQAQRPMSL